MKTKYKIRQNLKPINQTKNIIEYQKNNNEHAIKHGKIRSKKENKHIKNM